MMPKITHRRFSSVLALAAAISLIPAAGALAGPAGPAQVDGARIIHADKEPQNWMSTGRTYSEQRFSPLKQINKGNVAKLGLAWSFDTDTFRGLEATPIVVDGVMYTTGSWNMIYALDAKTGKELWHYDPKTNRAVAPHLCCDAINRGVAVWKGRVYSGTLDGRLIALDAGTGKLDWSVQTTDPTKPYSITGAPRIVKGRVIIGNGGSEYAVRGYITAYDAITGKQDWRFYIVPGDPGKPLESPDLKRTLKTWSGEWWKVGGGGSAWDSMAYDPDLDLLYVGTGNGSPWSEKVRSPGDGDNLYLSSILAIRPETGRLKWYYQVTPGDKWDYDNTQHMILANLKINGKMRKVLMQAPKNGFFYVLDRTTGKLLSAKEYVEINWATGFDMKTGRPIISPNANYEKSTKIIKPSPLGGHSWQPMSFDPATGLVYFPVNDIPYPYEPEDKKFKIDPVSFNTGVPSPIGALPGNLAKGRLMAWDPVAQKEAWHVEYSGPWDGGTLSTAGGLVFEGTADRRFIAFDAATGEKLWQSASPSGIIAAPVTYAVDGQQYVAVMAGWGGIWGLLGTNSAKATGNTRGTPGHVLVFKLGGKASLPMDSVAAAEPVPPAEQPTGDAAQIKLGEKVYHERCSNCHGGAAIGGGVLPDLRDSLVARDKMIFDVVLKGAFADKGMPNFGSVLTTKDVAAMQQYILQQGWLEQHPPK